MGRIIGLIGGTCLLIAVLRLTNWQHDDRTLLGGVDVAEAQSKLSPREAYRKGKELYLRGRYDEALALLEQATGSTTGLTTADRRQAEEYLSRTRLKLAQRALDESGARAQSPDQDPFAESMADANRLRVEKLLALANDALRKGDKTQALKHAQAAHELAKASKLKFAPGEPSPAALLAQLQPKPTTSASKSAVPANGLPDWAQERSAVTTAAGQEEPATIEFTGGVETASQQPSGKALSAREHAVALVKSARDDIKAGRYDDARRKALEASELDVTFDLFEDRPLLVLADVDRHTGTVTAARSPQPNFDKALANATTKPQAAKATPSQPVAAAASSVETQRQQALQLLKSAREDLKNGNFDAAQEKAQQAQKLEVAYKLFDDLPEVVLNDIAAHRAASNIAQAAPAKRETAPDAKVTPAASAELRPSAREQARQLLSQAREALKQGHIDEARQLAVEAKRLNVAYELFDDQPEFVLADVARAANRAAPPAVKPEVTAQQTAPTPVNAAPAQPAAVASRTQATQLLKEARQLMQAGRFDEARAKAEAADKLNVAYGLWDLTPDQVLAEIERATNGNVAQATPNNVSEDVEIANAVFDATPTPAANNVAAAAAEAPLIAEIAPSGLSARQLFQQGMTHLGRGNRAEAYRAFVQAHQTGQRLDPIRQQQLQNYLRELAPRNGSKIQLASNSVADGDQIAQRPALDIEPAPLDAAAQQQSVRFDRLRTETLNAVFRAERLRAKDPEQALQIIEQAMASVEGADLGDQAAASLLKSLQKTRASLQAEIVRQQPNLEQMRHNKEVEQRIITDQETKIFIEQEFAKLVEEFNELMEQRRFAEAEVVAKKAYELNPKESSAIVMKEKAKLARRIDSNNQLKEAKGDSYWEQLNDVEIAAIVSVGDAHPMDFPRNWHDLSKNRSKYHAGRPARTEDEIRIEQSLEKRVSLHEENAPLSEIIKKIATVADINIVFDPNGLEEEGVNSHTPVTIDVDGIMVKSALNLMLDHHHLGYTIKDETLMITSRIRQQGDLKVVNYSVADLVIPIPTQATMAAPMGGLVPAMGGMGGGQMNVPSNGFASGQPFAQVAPGAVGPLGTAPDRLGGPSSDADFDSLVDLIQTTISPDSWIEVGGTGTVRPFETTLSLVIRQTQQVHEEIADLLEQLRRLQDLQVTVEVRFVTVADRFFERVGIDFDFALQDTVGGPDVDNANTPLLPFGSVRVPQAGFAVAGQQAQQQQGQQAQQAQQAVQFFTPDPTRELTNRDRYPRNGTIVGLTAPETFSQNLDVPFSQGSFELGVPDFGGFQPNAGLSVGMAVLSDIEAFFFIQAAQGDERSNLMFAPKVTLFNGQFASVSDFLQRPFVTSLIPTVGVFSTGFQPVISTLTDGVSLSVQAVISADRRFVRLFVFPQFTNVTDVFTFSFIGGGGAGVAGGGGLGQQGQGGGGFGGQGGGFGGGGIGGGGFGGGQFGIGGGMGTTQMVMNGLFSQQQQQGQQGQGGQRGQQNQQGNLSQLTVTVQQPVQEIINVTTTVSVPDGGTVLLGGIKRLREGRNMAGVPILNKIPYVSRLFKNTGVGRETESLMLMVTPRIIIQEEEEELLGIPLER